MSFFSDFFHSGPFLALLVSSLIFILTIFLVAKEWINLSVTAILLLFAVVTGLVINYQQGTQCIFDDLSGQANSQALHDQDVVIVNQLKQDVQVLQTQIQQLTTQVQTLTHEIELQKIPAQTQDSDQ